MVLVLLKSELYIASVMFIESKQKKIYCAWRVSSHNDVHLWNVYQIKKIKNLKKKKRRKKKRNS